ncbi:MAG: hypothetical protein ACE37B_06365 [Ilumatobacter sp.]|uniref:hypothetical protein n=1 Tax=Ilumatobacter sp. TaxID=1967498 RepID=UPI00391CDB85
MSRDHLRHQAGGNPAQGPPPDMANPTPGPAVGHDFPDAPDQPDAPVQDQPDRDAFAARLGVTGDGSSWRGDARDDQGTDQATERSDDRSGGRLALGERVEGLRQRAAGVAASGAARLADGVGNMASRLERLAQRLRPDDRSG